MQLAATVKAVFANATSFSNSFASLSGLTPSSVAVALIDVQVVGGNSGLSAGAKAGIAIAVIVVGTRCAVCVPVFGSSILIALCCVIS